VIPAELKRMLDDDMIYVGGQDSPSGLDLGAIRRALREQRKIRIVYTDQAGATKQRIIWPLMIGFVESRRFISGWCELRQDFLLFRAESIQDAEVLDENYPGDRRRMVKEWRSTFCPSQSLDPVAE
jgi:predicted DNA-binding transcriptional regulator YafY